MTAARTWAILQRANEDGDHLGSRGSWRMTAIPEAGVDYERLGQDNARSMTGLCALCWKRTPGTVGSGSKSRMNCWLRLNGTIAAVLRGQGHADSSTVHRCLCELY